MGNLEFNLKKSTGSSKESWQVQMPIFVRIQAGTT